MKIKIDHVMMTSTDSVVHVVVIRMDHGIGD